jgi:ferredoxin
MPTTIYPTFLGREKRMPIITLQDGRTFEVPLGRRLVLALMDQGVDILHRCGGNARCTTCRVIFSAGEPSRMTEAEHHRLSERDLLGQARLSCQITCDHDMTLHPVLSLKSEGLDDAGPLPHDEITPPPVWRE